MRHNHWNNFIPLTKVEDPQVILKDAITPAFSSKNQHEFTNLAKK